MNKGEKSGSCLVIIGLDSRTNFEVLHKVFHHMLGQGLSSATTPQPIVGGDTEPIHLFDQDD